MRTARRLKDAGSEPLDAARTVACDWVRANGPVWRAWIPVICPAGQEANFALTACSQCTAGSYCPGGVKDPLLCPPGFYCPDGVSAPVLCPGGRTTAVEGAASVTECTGCVEGMVAGGGGTCISFATIVPAVVVPVAAVAAATVYLYMLNERRKADSLCLIQAREPR